MTKMLDEIRAILFRGMRCSMQSAYGRRAPSPPAIPLLTKAREMLDEYTKLIPDDWEGWDLLARAEESLLHYTEARKALERAVELSGKRDKKTLKRIALYQQLEKQWRALLLTPEELQRLGNYLRERLASGANEKTFKWTEAWLIANRYQHIDGVLESFRQAGAFYDFQVAENLARG
jgi:tetratricopeptide (TPR) repeat protein